MMKIAIVDDESRIHEELGGYILDAKKEQGLDLEIIDYYSAEEFLEGDDDISILLMDIQMPGIDGMTAAKEFRKKNSQAVLIFITNVIDYAIQGYSVEALDYILKPINGTRFKLLLSKAYRISFERQAKFISIKTDGNILKLNVNDIIYVEIDDHLLIFHYRDQKSYSTWLSMAKVSKMLPDDSFGRISNSLLVNLNEVAMVKKDSILLKYSGLELPLIGSRKKEFLEKIGNSLRNV